jgi:hypothetical protein
MKRLSTKIVLLALVGMLAFSITIVSAQGWWKTVYLRPIDDWMANNPWGATPGWGGYDYEDDWSILRVTDNFYSFFDFIYSGFVLEEVMPDGSCKYTVWLWGRDQYMEVYNARMDPYPYLYREDLVLIGTLNFFWRVQFIMAPSYPGGWTPWTGNIPPGTRGPGDPLPYFLIIAFFPDVIGAQIVFGYFKGSGSGALMAPGSYWDPDLGDWDPPLNPTGETANVFVHQEWKVDQYGVEIWTAEWLIIS